MNSQHGGKKNGANTANFCCLPLSEVIICSAMVCSFPCAAVAPLLLISLLCLVAAGKEVEIKCKDLCCKRVVACKADTFIPKRQKDRLWYGGFFFFFCQFDLKALCVRFLASSGRKLHCYKWMFITELTWSHIYSTLQKVWCWDTAALYTHLLCKY